MAYTQPDIYHIGQLHRISTPLPWLTMLGFLWRVMTFYIYGYMGTMTIYKPAEQPDTAQMMTTPSDSNNPSLIVLPTINKYQQYDHQQLPTILNQPLNTQRTNQPWPPPTPERLVQRPHIQVQPRSRISVARAPRKPCNGCRAPRCHPPEAGHFRCIEADRHCWLVGSWLENGWQMIVSVLSNSNGC